MNILYNPHHGPLTPDRIAWAFHDTSYVRRYLPLGWLSFSAVSTVSQLSPWGYHAANILLHSVNAMLLALLLRRLLATWRPAEAAAHPGWLDAAALLTAAWWALHPLRVEPTAWCSAIPSNLAMTFLLAALLAHSSTSRLGWPGAILLFAGALLSYPVTLGAMIFFPALDWARGQKQLVLRALPFVALTLLCGFINLHARVEVSAAQAAPATLAEFPLGMRIAQAGCVWAHYLWIPWYPFHLSPVYRDFLHLQYGSLQVVGSAALLLLVVFLAGRSPARWVMLVSYGVVVFPFTGFTESPHFPHDRYAALPGLIMAAGLGVLLLKWRSQAVAVAGGVLVLGTRRAVLLAAAALGKPGDAHRGDPHATPTGRHAGDPRSASGDLEIPRRRLPGRVCLAGSRDPNPRQRSGADWPARGSRQAVGSPSRLCTDPRPARRGSAAGRTASPEPGAGVCARRRAEARELALRRDQAAGAGLLRAAQRRPQAYALTFLSVSDIITPRRKRVTCPELDETTSAMQSAATEMAAAAAWRDPSPLGSVWL